jgi:cholinesterase
MPPVAPRIHRTIQTSGQYPISCPQAQPSWLGLFGKPVENLTGIPPVEEGDLGPPARGSSEDCLFLDILVPESVFGKQEKKVPIIVFLHGGGYVQGSKTAFGPGIGLLEAAAQNGQDLIYMSINYRLGLFVSKPCLWSYRYPHLGSRLTVNNHGRASWPVQIVLSSTPTLAC